MAAVIGNRNISLGVLGNRLITACAGFGGDVFGCSPYDAATTAYLKATYPLYWAQIRDYGFANPQLVPFINEDNDLIVSLVGVGKERWLVGENKATHYFVLDKCNTANTRIEVDFKVNNLTNWVLFSTYQTRIFALSNSTYAGWGTGRVQYSYPYAVGTKYHGSFQSSGMKVNGTTIGGVGTGYGSNLMNVGHDLQNGSIQNNISCGKIDWYESEELVSVYCPFKRNGQMELLDIVTGTLATRVGTFTELIE